MTINEKKLLRQLKGKEKWRNSKLNGSPKNGCGTLNYFTGVGKTYTAILILMELLKKDNSRTVHIIVPSEALEKQWHQEIRKIVPEDLLSNIKVNTVHQILVDNILRQVSLLIVDEIHEFLGDERIGVVDGRYFTYSYILGLTATFDDKLGRIDRLKTYCPVVDVINEEEALKEGYISNFVEFNLAVELTDLEKQEYKLHTDTISKQMNKFGKAGFEGASKVLVGDDKYSGYAYACMWAYKNGWKKDYDPNDAQEAAINNLWNPSKIIGYAKQLMESVRARKNVIYNADNKLIATIELIRKFDTLKTICFSQSTQFADRLQITVNKELEQEVCVVYHSKLVSRPLKDDLGEFIRIKTGMKKGELKLFGKSTLRDYAIDRIRTGKSRIISTASSLDKGFDVEDIELGITTSGTANPTQYKQRGGRVKRLKTYRPETIVIIVNVYIPRTKDEDSLIERQKKNSHEVHWIKSIDEIGYNRTLTVGNSPFI